MILQIANAQNTKGDYGSTVMVVSCSAINVNFNSVAQMTDLYTVPCNIKLMITPNNPSLKVDVYAFLEDPFFDGPIAMDNRVLGIRLYSIDNAVHDGAFAFWNQQAKDFVVNQDILLAKDIKMTGTQPIYVEFATFFNRYSDTQSQYYRLVDYPSGSYYNQLRFKVVCHE